MLQFYVSAARLQCFDAWQGLLSLVVCAIQQARRTDTDKLDCVVPFPKVGLPGGATKKRNANVMVIASLFDSRGSFVLVFVFRSALQAGRSAMPREGLNYYITSSSGSLTHRGVVQGRLRTFVPQENDSIKLNRQCRANRRGDEEHNAEMTRHKS